jgi:hypothetical protein
MTTLGRAKGVGQDIIEVVSSDVITVCPPGITGKNYIGFDFDSATDVITAYDYNDGTYVSTLDTYDYSGNSVATVDYAALISVSPDVIVVGFAQLTTNLRIVIWNVTQDTGAVINRSAEHSGGFDFHAPVSDLVNKRVYWLESKNVGVSTGDFWLCYIDTTQAVTQITNEAAGVGIATDGVTGVHAFCDGSSVLIPVNDDYATYTLGKLKFPVTGGVGVKAADSDWLEPNGTVGDGDDWLGYQFQGHRIPGSSAALVQTGNDSETNCTARVTEAGTTLLTPANWNLDSPGLIHPSPNGSQYIVHQATNDRYLRLQNAIYDRGGDLDSCSLQWVTIDDVPVILTTPWMFFPLD